MFKKFLAAGVLAAACIGGIGSVYAADFSNHKTAVVYFTLLQNREMASNDSQAGKKAGNAEILATMIADATNGDLYSLKTVKKYPSDYDESLIDDEEFLDSKNINCLYFFNTTDQHQAHVISNLRSWNKNFELTNNTLFVRKNK